MILRQSPTKQQGLMLTLCGALSALLMGCLSTGKRTIQAERPVALDYPGASGRGERCFDDDADNILTGMCLADS